MDPGDKARCLIDSAGVLDPDSFRAAFHPTVIVSEGEELAYLGPHPNPALEGWHMFEYTRDGQNYVVPLGEGQYEAAAKTPKAKRPPSTKGLSDLLP